MYNIEREYKGYNEVRMKRFLIAIAVLCCSFLYAETYNIYDELFFCQKESVNFLDYDSERILSILPYQNGSVVKMQDSQNNHIEFFITKGTVFYIAVATVDWNITYYKCTVTDIKPNELIINKTEITDNK